MRRSHIPGSKTGQVSMNNWTSRGVKCKISVLGDLVDSMLLTHLGNSESSATDDGLIGVR